MPTEEELLEGFDLGEWEVLPSKGVLRRGDQEERPEPKVFAVLIALAKRDTNLVTKQQLVDEVWDGRPMGDEPIARCLSQLRGHLDDRQKPHQLIETLQRRGYRLKQRVRLHKQPDAVTSAPQAGPSLRQWKIVAAVLVIGFVAIAVYIQIQGPIVPPDPPPPARSIAVMPFDNFSSAASDEYLALGFKEVLVQTLHRIKDYKVKNGRVKYNKEPVEIAKMLGVANILFGSLRRDGNMLAINYHISAGRQGVIFSGDVKGPVDQLFSLQESLAEKVRRDLDGESMQTLFKSRPSNSDAYDSYMRGVYALEHRGAEGNLTEAIVLFKTAIDLDKKYGPPYLALATAYALMPDYHDAPLEEMNRLALETVEDGIAADPVIEDAAGAIYGFVYHKQKRWREAEEAYLRAVSADVVDSNAFNWYSRMLASVGRLDDALDQALHAIEIDPSNAVINSRIAINYSWLMDSDKANEYFVRSDDLGASGATHMLAYALLLERDGQLEKALSITKAAVQMAGGRANWVEPLLSALRDPTKAAAALQLLDEVEAAEQLPPQVSFVARAMLGDIDGAMRVARLLENPGEIFEMDLLFIPELQAFRQHPEFMPLLDRLEVTDYWQSKGCTWKDDRVWCTAD